MLFPQIFSHHPDCDLYDHHVFRIGRWRFCVGCSGLYSAFVLTMLTDFFVYRFTLDERAIIGFLMFVPALVQLKWKSRTKWIKFLMRASLGVTAYLLLSLTVLLPVWWQKLGMGLLYGITVSGYSRVQGGKQLLECEACVYGESYPTCSRRFSKVLSIDGIEMIHGIVTGDLRRVIELKVIRDFQEARNQEKAV